MAPEDYQVRWEYAEKSKGKQGWFEMYDCIAKQLEEVTTDNSVAEEPSELRLPDEDGVVWKFDLIEMTQRRLKDDNDENTRVLSKRCNSTPFLCTHLLLRIYGRISAGGRAITSADVRLDC